MIGITPPKHIAIVTDAWDPQTNGVVRVLKDRKRVLEEMGYRVSMITAEDYHTVRFPPYPEIRPAIFEKNRTISSPIRLSKSVGQKLEELKPDYIHIATAAEGTLGPAAIRFCRRNKLSYTSEMHSRLPEYAAAYVAKIAGQHSVPSTTKMGYAWVRSHHQGAAKTLVPSQSMVSELAAHGLENLVACPHGVDTELFHPGESRVFDAFEQPIFLYVGRVAVEKGIDKFLALDLPGTKVVVGDGPERKRLEKEFCDANIKFLGKKSGADLVAHYQGASVVVFPSITDTFGNVNVEALACGKPVAAFPASGVKDIISRPEIGALNTDLRKACLDALELSKKKETADTCRKEAVDNYQWKIATNNFLSNLVEVGSPNTARSHPMDDIWNAKPRHPRVAESDYSPAR